MSNLRLSALALIGLSFLGASLPAQGNSQGTPHGRGIGHGRSGAGSQPLPEPGTIVLLALGAGGTGLALRRRRRTGAALHETS